MRIKVKVMKRDYPVKGGNLTEWKEEFQGIMINQIADRDGIYGIIIKENGDVVLINMCGLHSKIIVTEEL